MQSHTLIITLCSALLFSACAQSEGSAPIAIGAAAAAVAAPPAPAAAPIGLSDGAPSIDALLDEFVAAVEAHDAAALHKLRVTKAEYDGIIVPGMVAKGQPPRQVSEQPREWFWSLNDTKSRYFADDMFSKYAGRHYVQRQLTLTEPVQEWAWYSVHGEVRLALTATDQKVYELRTGSIAEVDGRYKFISFIWDD